MSQRRSRINYASHCRHPDVGNHKLSSR